MSEKKFTTKNNEIIYAQDVTEFKAETGARPTPEYLKYPGGGFPREEKYAVLHLVTKDGRRITLTGLEAQQARNELDIRCSFDL